MDCRGFQRLTAEQLASLQTPCFVVSESALRENLRILQSVKKQTGARILLALKGFAMWRTFKLVSGYLDGTAASSLHEAQLGHEEMHKEVHLYAPAFSEAGLTASSPFASHVVFNSAAQFNRLSGLVRDKSLGLRINPEYAEVEVPLYNPCAPHSRLGAKAQDLANVNWDAVDGLHFHVMCEQGAETLQRVLDAVEQRFGDYIPHRKWINFGGGHHITRPDYNLDLLVQLVNGFQDRYDTQVYLEPGEAVALDAGILVATVLDVVHNDMDIAILDTSAEAHMPDVLAMPYRPHVVGSGRLTEKKYGYRLAGNTCLAGDVIGDYAFDAPLTPGDKLVFTDMAIYSMVKTTTFNGVGLPAIYLYQNDMLQLIRQFGYIDYKSRLS